MALRTTTQQFVTYWIGKIVRGAWASIVQEILAVLGMSHAHKVMRVTGNTTLTAADSGTTVLVAGAATITLPAAAEGLSFRVCVIAAVNTTITAGANEIIGLNNAASDSISYTTAANQIGAVSEFMAVNFDGAGDWRYIHLQMCEATATVAA